MDEYHCSFGSGICYKVDAPFDDPRKPRAPSE